MREVERLFASVPSGRQILTVDGLTFDYVHYRHNPDGIASIIDNGHRFMPFADRLTEDAKVHVTIRVWEFDIDKIEVLDEQTNEWHEMWSTDPAYTGGLSRWEHHHYMDFLASKNRGRKRQRARVDAKSKREILREFDDELFDLGIRSRGKRFALIEAEEQRLQKLEGVIETDRPSDEPLIRSWAMTPAGADRNDLPAPPPQPPRNTGRKKREHEPPARSEDYGLASTAELTRAAPDARTEGAAGPYRFKRRRKSDED